MILLLTTWPIIGTLYVTASVIFENYSEQKFKKRGERTARLLKANVEKVVSEHKNGVVLTSAHGNGLVKCVNVEPENSPSVGTSEALKKIRCGQTSCASICGTQVETPVKRCLSNSHTTKYSVKDNHQCKAASPFKSENALKSEYMDQARQGVYKHERAWRKNQRIGFNGECKEPMEGNFNPYPGSEIDTVDGTVPYKQFKSFGVDFNKGCTLDTFPKLFPEKKDPLQSLICEDNSQDQPFNPGIQSISGEELETMLKELHDSISTKVTESCPEPE